MAGGMLDFLTGGKTDEASDYQKQALAGLMGVGVPSSEQLTLPELQKYAVSQNMSPAQMQAFLQQNNALNAPVDQAGTAAQKAAISQLAGVANAGAEGSATQRAQIEQVNQDAARNLAGQRGAIDQQAAARGVPVGMLQAALQGQQAGQGQQDAHMAAVQAQGQNYQQALAAMASGAGAGQALQGQQNTQANTVGQAQNAMQQFNAANQQNASQNNAANQQQANMTNTQNANTVGQANTGLANQRTQYNAQVPETVFNNQMQKATGVANQYGNLANQATGQGQQTAGINSALIGGASTLLGGMFGGPAGAVAGNQAAKGLQGGTQTAAHGGVIQPYAHGGEVGHETCMHSGGICMVGGGMVPGRAKVPGDSLRNDTVTAQLSPGELVVPRSAMAGHHPQDVAALLAAMKHMRGA